MESERILVQFDGSNFYNKVKRINKNIHLTNFNYSKFCKKLTSGKSYQAKYYVGEIKYNPHNNHALKLYNGQQALFYNLEKQNVEVKLGYLLRSNGKFLEKGVDVQIAVDMVDGAADNIYETCFLISSDTDLIPAVNSSIRRGKRVIYVGFENQLSIALNRICSETLIIDKDFLENSYYL